MQNAIIYEKIIQEKVFDITCIVSDIENDKLSRKDNYLGIV